MEGRNILSTGQIHESPEILHHYLCETQFPSRQCHILMGRMDGKLQVCNHVALPQFRFIIGCQWCCLRVEAQGGVQDSGTANMLSSPMDAMQRDSLSSSNPRASGAAVWVVDDPRFAFINRWTRCITSCTTNRGVNIPKTFKSFSVWLCCGMAVGVTSLSLNTLSPSPSRWA